jgi:hypothetical protein
MGGRPRDPARMLKVVALLPSRSGCCIPCISSENYLEQGFGVIKAIKRPQFASKLDLDPDAARIERNGRVEWGQSTNAINPTQPNRSETETAWLRERRRFGHDSANPRP